MTIRDAVRDGAALLGGTGSASPWLDASLLLGRSLGMDGTRLLASYPDEVADDARLRYRSLLERRASGECVAYILGSKEFRGLEFEVGPGVLVPRPDTEVLVEAALEACREDAAAREDAARDAAAGGSVRGPYRVHDACSGSGCVGISLARELHASLGDRDFEVELSDVSEEARAFAARNAERLLGRPLPVRAWDFMDGARADAYDLVTANPPYLTDDDMAALPEELAREPALALSGGRDGLDPLRALAPRALRALAPGGAFLAEIGSWQAEGAAAILSASGFASIRVLRDLAGLDRVLASRKPEGRARG